MPDPVVEKFELAKDPAFIELQKSLKGMLAIMQQQGQSLASFQKTITEMSTKGGKNGKDTENDDETDDNDEDDPETMAPGKFQKFIIAQVGKLLDSKLKGVTDQLEGTTKNIRMTELSREAQQLMADHKDFKDWQDEMGELAKQHPTLRLNQLYKLARDGNETKAKELDTKYKKPEEKKDDGLSIFGGLRPTGSVKTGNDEKPEKMTATQAADKAWEETVQQFPGLAKLSDDALD